MKTDNYGFGANIKRRRIELGLTQAELARKVWPEIFSYQGADKKVCEQKRKNIVNYEKGTFPKDGATYYDLCSALDCDMDFLFGRIEQSTHERADLMEITGLSENAIINLMKNGSGYWPALSSVLENEAFWQFLKIMETYKQVETSGDTIGSYVGAGIESTAQRLIPDPEKEDMEIFTEEFFKTVCTRYCWLLMDAYKKL